MAVGGKRPGPNPGTAQGRWATRGQNVERSEPMADSFFDIVSRIDRQEVDNLVR
jgi:iron uptake system EfeUOB component EfeO/EfeM